MKVVITPDTRDQELDAMIGLALDGIARVSEIQQKVLGGGA